MNEIEKLATSVEPALDGLSPADRAALAGGLDALEKLLGHP